MATGNGHSEPAAGVEAYLAEHAAFIDGLASSEHRPAPGGEGIDGVRSAAIERFAAAGVPTTRDEEWRFTDVSSIADRPFRLATGDDVDVGAEVEPWLVPGALHLVVVNGKYRPDLSSPDAPDDEVRAGGMAAALGSRPQEVLSHLDRTVDSGANPFAALNTAFTLDGAHVYVPRRVVAARPIQILHVSSPGSADRVMSLPRTLVVLDESAQATVIETFVGPAGRDYLTCPVTELVVGPNAWLDHYRIQQEGSQATHLGAQHVRQDRDSVVVSHNVALGGATVRTDVRAKLDGEGVDCTLNGIYIASGRQHVDTHMWVEHVKPHSSSHELYKGILDDDSRAVFNGRIFVHREAQKTDAKQSNRNLLLSERALVNSNPQLEIFADDVKCTHGSTVGQLDDEALFYLRSRGLALDAARSLLIYAFASDILGSVRSEPVRRVIESALAERLPRGEIVRELA